jgi:hypothetical protein
MHQYVKIFVVPLLAGKRWRRVCEIGASLGEGTDLLMSVTGVQDTVIDPCLDCDLSQKFSGNPNVSVKKGTSLEILPQLDGAFDCILIDGDHNWYTVYEELKTISGRNLLRPGGIIFFHDVEWPWGRRDMYYQPGMIPPEYLHPWEQQGLVRGKSELSEEFTIHSYFKKATHEGGARNGVLTAIEDFLEAHKADYRFFQVHAGCGLGVMQYRGGFRDSLSFLWLRWKGVACNIAFSTLQWTRGLLPPALLGKDPWPLKLR